VACRRIRPKRELLRIARRPDGTIAFDANGRSAGRGAYVCDDPACRARAIDKGALARALSVRIPDDVAAGVVGEAR